VTVPAPETVPAASAESPPNRRPGRFGSAEVFTLPAVCWLLLIFVIPVAILLGTSFLQHDGVTVSSRPTMSNYSQLFTDRTFLEAMWATIWTSVATGVNCVVLAYPVAHFLVRSRSRLRLLALALVVSPLVASVVVRTYGWMVLLDNDGLVNQVLQDVGITDHPIHMLGTYWAIVVGLTHVLLPFSVFTIMSALQSIDPSLENAARDLKAGPFAVFFRVTFPLSLPGVLAGFVLTVAISLGAYATPHILGAGRTQTLATKVRDAMTVTLEWGQAAAMAVVILVLGLVVVLVLLWLSKLARQRIREGTP
jgi:putative spermidine/putrescine transport system permease protein